MLAARHQFVRQLLRRHPVLARGGVQRLHARLHHLQAFGVQVEEAAHSLNRYVDRIDLDQRRVQRRQDVTQRGVDVSHLAQALHHAVEPRQHRAIGLGQRLQRSAAALDQPGGV